MQTTSTKPKARPPTSAPTGVYKSDSIKDIAESLNVTLPENVATLLAGDVEYRINQVIEEAARFMRHGRRTVLTTSDIDQALRVLNIEPLYGHNTPSSSSSLSTLANLTSGTSSLNLNGGAGGTGASGVAAGALAFRRALPFPQLTSAGTVYFVEDEEIDFDRVLREEKVNLPKGVSWHAHWLAVEGVQPLVPENPPAIPREVEPTAGADGAKANGDSDKPKANGVLHAQHQNPLLPFGASTNLPPGSKRPLANQQTQSASGGGTPLVKQVLSRELQLYYARLTSSLVPPSAASDGAKRTAALASLRHDAGLQALLPYLVRWVGEGVVGALKESTSSGDTPGKTLEVLLEVVGAILENTTLFVEPYLHQILPPVLSILLHSSLPTTQASALRTTASQTLSKLLTQHSTTYPSLSPRIMKTLLLALISPGKSSGTREGAVRGLVGVGKEAVRKGLVEGGGARVIAAEWEAMGSDTTPSGLVLMQSVLEALRVMQPVGLHMSDALDMQSDEDRTLRGELDEVLGPFFASQVAGDKAWVKEVLGRGT